MLYHKIRKVKRMTFLSNGKFYFYDFGVNVLYFSLLIFRRLEKDLYIR